MASSGKPIKLKKGGKRKVIPSDEELREAISKVLESNPSSSGTEVLAHLLMKQKTWKVSEKRIEATLCELRSGSAVAPQPSQESQEPPTLLRGQFLVYPGDFVSDGERSGVVSRVGGFVGDVGEQDDDEDEDEEGGGGPIPEGKAEIMWTSDWDLTVDDARSLEVLDRPLQVGTAVGRRGHELETLGVVTRTTRRLVVRRVGTNAHEEDFEVDAGEISELANITECDTVIHKQFNWIGEVLAVSFRVSVLLDDGISCWAFMDLSEISCDSEDLENEDVAPAFLSASNVQGVQPVEPITVGGRVFVNPIRLEDIFDEQDPTSPTFGPEIGDRVMTGIVTSMVCDEVAVDWKLTQVCVPPGTDLFPLRCQILDVLRDQPPPKVGLPYDELAVLPTQDDWEMDDVGVMMRNGEHITVAVISTRHTIVDVCWSDGTTSENVLSTELVPRSLLGENDYRLFDLVVRSESALQGRYEWGIVTGVDPAECTVKVVWSEHESDGEVEMSAYDLNDLGERFEVGSQVARKQANKPFAMLVPNLLDSPEEPLHLPTPPSVDGSMTAASPPPPQQEPQQTCSDEYQTQFITTDLSALESLPAYLPFIPIQLSKISQVPLQEAPSNSVTQVQSGMISRVDIRRPLEVEVTWTDGTTEWVDVRQLLLLRLDMLEGLGASENELMGPMEWDIEGGEEDEDDEDEDGIWEDISDEDEEEEEEEEEEEVMKDVPQPSETQGLENGKAAEEEQEVTKENSAPDVFEMLEVDCVDHKFRSNVSNVKPQKAVKEHRILAKGLPENMIVRGFSDRLDLLRAMIIGPPDTPYADVPFFFDIQLSPTHPHTPPSVHFLSTSNERLNPNLYEDGKVCLSLLGTWSGPGWIDGTSNVLQVLLSIQALILVEKPFFNEPGFEKQLGTEEGEINSKRYSEKARLLSLRAALNWKASAPIGFEEHLARHFSEAGNRILDSVRSDLEQEGNSGADSRQAEEQATPLASNLSSGYLQSLRRMFPRFQEVFGSQAHQER